MHGRLSRGTGMETDQSVSVEHQLLVNYYSPTASGKHKYCNHKAWNTKAVEFVYAIAGNMDLYMAGLEWGDGMARRKRMFTVD